MMQSLQAFWCAVWLAIAIAALVPGSISATTEQSSTNVTNALVSIEVEGNGYRGCGYYDGSDYSCEFSVSAGNCSTRLPGEWFSYDENSMTIYCTTSGSIYVFGYSDYNCTNVTAAIRISNDTMVNDARAVCPQVITDTPNMPNFPPAEQVVISECSAGDCSTNCTVKTFLPNICRQLADPFNPVSAFSSMRATCSNTSAEVTVERFNDMSCGDYLASVTATTVDTCFGHEPSTQISCPIGVAKAAMPEFPPPASVVTLQNCTDSSCSQNCTKHAAVINALQDFRPGNNTIFGNYPNDGIKHPVILSYIPFCAAENSQPGYFACQSRFCYVDYASFGVTHDQKSTSCHLEGKTYTQSSCNYSAAAAPYIPAPYGFMYALRAYNTSDCSNGTASESWYTNSPAMCVQSPTRSVQFLSSTNASIYEGDLGCSGEPFYAKIDVSQCVNGLRTWYSPRPFWPGIPPASHSNIAWIAAPIIIGLVLVLTGVVYYRVRRKRTEKHNDDVIDISVPRDTDFYQPNEDPVATHSEFQVLDRTEGQSHDGLYGGGPTLPTVNGSIRIQ